MRNLKAIRRALLGWYARAARALPWRATRDPYRIWVSEIMLQQTRVAAVLPYYERFLARFPDAAALARAGEAEVLACWSGLGYYTRARNLREAARRVVRNGGFPQDYAGIRALPGVGEYTAAAIASIAFSLPHAVVDGNVRRVLARLSNDHGQGRPAEARRRLAALAGQLLEPLQPGAFNQAVMELGATICLPRQPRCLECPLARHCMARRLGTASKLPMPRPRRPSIRVEKTLLLIRRGRRVLFTLRGGFWELPEAGQVPGAKLGEEVARLHHSITNHNYRVTVVAASLEQPPPNDFRWLVPLELSRFPLNTLAKKALRL